MQTGHGENTKWTAPVLGVTVTQAAAGADPSAVQNTSCALRVDLPVYLKAKQRESSVLELPLSLDV